MFVPEEINPLSLNWALALKPICSATTRISYNKLFGFVSVAGLMGMSGISIRKKVNTTSGGGSMTVFDGCSTGVVLFKTDSTNMAGRYDAVIFVVNNNSVRVVKFNEGSDNFYQTFENKDGVLTIKNTGYGLANFTAYHIR